MPFMNINGWQVPVRSKEARPLEIGKRDFAFDGTPMNEIRATKRVWTCKTPPLTELVAEAVRGIVLGLGWVWPFVSDLWSHKGLGPATTWNDKATPLSYLAGDGSPVSLMEYLHADAESNYTPTRSGILSVDNSATNLFAADQRDAEGVAAGSYSPINGATISMDTDNYWQGSQSVKVVTDAVGADIEGVETDAIDPGALSNNRTYTASVYVKNGSGSDKAIKVTLVDVTSSASGTVAVITIPNGEWARFASTVDIGSTPCRDMRLRIEENVQDSAATYYCDGFMVTEEDYPSAWVDGARSTDALAYSIGFEGKCPDWSIGTWFWGPAVARWPGTNEANIWSVISDTFVRWSVLRRKTTSSDQITLTTVDAEGAYDEVSTGTGDVDWEAWNFIGVSHRADPETGESSNTMRLINGSGSTTYTDTTAAPVYMEGKLHVGNQYDVNPWIGHLGELIAWPFAVPVEVWDGIASTMGQAGDGSAEALPLPQWPRKLVTGDGAPLQQIGRAARDHATLFEGRVTGMTTAQANDGIEWRNDLQELDFELRQV